MGKLAGLLRSRTVAQHPHRVHGWWLTRQAHHAERESFRRRACGHMACTACTCYRSHAWPKSPASRYQASQHIYISVRPCQVRRPRVVQDAPPPQRGLLERIRYMRVIACSRACTALRNERACAHTQKHKGVLTQHMLLAAHETAGSPLYLSPEVWQSARCSHKSDIWSIGCVAYELLTHRPPFSAPELAHKVLTSTPLPLPGVYSPSLTRLVFDMLRKDPNARPGSTELLQHPSLSSFVKRWLAAGFSPLDGPAY
jgi:hypothetical protein